MLQGRAKACNAAHGHLLNVGTFGKHGWEYLFILFFLQKTKHTEIAEEIAKAEEQLLDIFQQEYPSYSRTQILRLYLMELGAIAYNLKPEDALEVFDFPREAEPK